MNLFKKLLNVQSELKAPKGQFNSFGKYKYRSCEDIVEAVKPLLKEEGLLMTITDDLKLIGERYYIKATVTVIDTETGEKHEVEGFAREEENKKGMDGSQVTGASSSYARKYALNGMFAIDDTKDSDSTNTHGAKQHAEKESTGLSEAQVKRLYTIAGKKGYTTADVKTHIAKKYNKISVADLTKKEYDEAVAGYEKLEDKK